MLYIASFLLYLEEVVVPHTLSENGDDLPKNYFEIILTLITFNLISLKLLPGCSSGWKYLEKSDFVVVLKLKF